MRIQVIDNVLDHFLIKYLHGFFLYNTPHTFTGGSAPGEGSVFYVAESPPRAPLIEYMFKKITSDEILNVNVSIIRTYLNIQHKEMDGAFHGDDGDLTLLLMITNNPKEGGGEFEYIDENKQIQKIEYKQNRLIAFDANIKHRGLAYKGNEPRITLAYKTQFNQNKIKK